MNTHRGGINAQSGGLKTQHMETGINYIEIVAKIVDNCNQLLRIN